MASSFKIKLKLPPNSAAGPSSSTQNSPQRSSVPAEGSSVADGGSSIMSEDGGAEAEEMDELEDSPPPPNSTSASPSSARAKRPPGKATSTSSTSKSGAVKRPTRPTIPMGLPKPIDQMTIEEIEALPAAKRRKSLKARGAAGPGRGWRKGLKMDQKPVYVQPGSSVGALPSKVASGTPASFTNSNSKVKSSLARDAISKTSTPLRSESPFSSGSPMPPNDNGNLDGTDTKIRKEDEKKATTATTTTTTSAPFRMYYRSTQPIHPIAKIPIGFATVLPLDKSGRLVRPWEKEVREIVSLTGKTWSSLTWLTRQESHAEIEKENQQNNTTNINTSLPPRTSNALGIDAVDTAPSTPGESTPFLSSNNRNNNTSSKVEHHIQSPATAAGTNPGSSPEVDWRGNSAAFSAANKRHS